MAPDATAAAAAKAGAPGIEAAPAAAEAAQAGVEPREAENLAALVRGCAPAAIRTSASRSSAAASMVGAAAKAGSSGSSAWPTICGRRTTSVQLPAAPEAPAPVKPPPAAYTAAAALSVLLTALLDSAKPSGRTAVTGGGGGGHVPPKGTLVERFGGGGGGQLTACCDWAGVTTMDGCRDCTPASTPAVNDQAAGLAVAAASQPRAHRWTERPSGSSVPRGGSARPPRAA